MSTWVFGEKNHEEKEIKEATPVNSPEIIASEIIEKCAETGVDETIVTAISSLPLKDETDNLDLDLDELDLDLDGTELGESESFDIDIDMEIWFEFK